MHNLHQFQYSLTHLGIAFFAILFLVSLLIMASISTYYNNLLHTQFYNNMMDILRLYNNESSSDLSTLETYLFQIATYNSDISVLNTTSDNMKYQNAKIRIHLLLSEVLPIFDRIDGLFFYSLPANDYIPACRSVATSECSNYIREILYSGGSDGAVSDHVYTSWLPYQAKNQTYLIRFFYIGDSVLGAWSSVNTLTGSFSGIFSEDSIICYADSEMHILENPEFSLFTPGDNDFLEHYQFYTSPQTQTRYLVACQPLTYSDCSLIAFIPLDHIDRFMLPVYQKLLIMIAILIAAVFLIAAIFKRLIDVPGRSLEKLLDKVSCEDENTLIPIDHFHCREISALNRTLYDMVQKIQNLKINIYEEKLLKAKLEMQYMKAQVSPHFLINCLTVFSTLATSPDPEGEHRYILRKMVDTLSNHLRYTLSSRSLVTLKEECGYVDNYLQLISIRYPECLIWTIDLPDCMQNALVFPMLLLMLTENSIKYNMIMGEKLRVIIRAVAEKKDDSPYLHLIHIDSGTGFSPESLNQCNNILDHPELCKNGHNIGIYNISKSLQLTYSGNAAITFSNEAGMGARVDIMIPYTLSL